MIKRCKNCNSSFEAKRKDSLYCSNACRQQNHTKKTTELVKEDNQTTYTFSQSEYYNLINEYNYDRETLTFVHFCFLKRNIHTQADLEKISLYILSISESWDLIRLEDLKSYRQFKEDFFDGKFVITE